MVDAKNIDGHWYPKPHRGWGGFGEELFHYTSRYHKTTEAFLRSLSGRETFTMTGYRAASLSAMQRQCMAAILSQPPETATAQALVVVVESVVQGADGVDAAIVDRYQCSEVRAAPAARGQSHPADDGIPADVGPLDPFLSIVERLQLPAAVDGRHVEISMHDLARHLDSPNATLRSNLHNAIITLHIGGFILRNHPHLTHAEARHIGADEDNGLT